MSATARIAAPAAMKTLTLTSSQLEDVRAALVEQRLHLDELRSLTYFKGSKDDLVVHQQRIDGILILVSKA